MVAATLRHLTSLRLMVGNIYQDRHEKCSTDMIFSDGMVDGLSFDISSEVIC